MKQVTSEEMLKEDDEASATSAWRTRAARALAVAHLAVVATRHFMLSPSAERNRGHGKCAVWGACSALAEVLGMGAAQALACNGTHYKPIGGVVGATKRRQKSLRRRANFF